MIRAFSFIIGLTLCALIPLPSYAASINAPQLDRTEDNIARGVLRAKATADITARMTGQLLEAPYKAGQFFKEGALLARFDCALQEAELTALQETYRSYSLKHKNAAELYKYGASGELDVALSKSDMQHAFAQINVMKARLKYCSVYAPFSGYVTARHMSAYESPQVGQNLYSLEKAGSLELSVIVPSKWIKWLKKGRSLEFTIDETGGVIQAEVIRLGASIDPVSQTFEIIAKPMVKSSALSGPLLSGMSGYARFKVVS